MSYPANFNEDTFISRVREIISIPASDFDELPDPVIREKANEIFMTQFIDYRFRSLFRKKITLPVVRFSARIKGFYLLDEYITVLDANRREETSIPIVYTAEGVRGTSYTSKTESVQSPEENVYITIHPFFLSFKFNGEPQFFDNTNFRFNKAEPGQPSFTYDEKNGSILIQRAVPNNATVEVAGFEKMAQNSVLFDGENFIFPEDITLTYGFAAFSVYGTLQPFNDNDLEPLFSNPLFFERLYLLTARELLRFFIQIEDPALYEKIEARLMENQKQLLSMARASLDITQRRFHTRSADAKFREMYGRRF